MSLLLDTHVVLWWRLNSRQLQREAREAIAAADRVMVSAASAWEVAIKAGIGRLRLGGEFASEVAAAGFEELPIGFPHTAHVQRLPQHHADPFDRMLVAQARVEGLTLVTHDRVMASYDVPIIWT